MEDIHSWPTLDGIAKRLGGMAVCLQPVWSSALRNKPTTVSGWLAVASAGGAVAAGLAVTSAAALLLLWCTCALLLGVALILGIIAGAWLCFAAWLCLVVSVAAGVVAAGGLLGGTTVRLLWSYAVGLLPPWVGRWMAPAAPPPNPPPAPAHCPADRIVATATATAAPSPSPSLRQRYLQHDTIGGSTQARPGPAGVRTERGRQQAAAACGPVACPQGGGGTAAAGLPSQLQSNMGHRCAPPDTCGRPGVEDCPSSHQQQQQHQHQQQQQPPGETVSRPMVVGARVGDPQKSSAPVRASKGATTEVNMVPIEPVAVAASPAEHAGASGDVPDTREVGAGCAGEAC